MKHLKYYFLFSLLFIITSYAQDSITIKDEDGDIIMTEENLVVGKPYYGRNNYIEYIPGNLPLVLSAPHGGYDRPESIKDRTRGTDHHDTQTLEVTLELQKCFYELTGKSPYVIINRLHRIKVDPNREFDLATQEDSLAAVAYKDFHGLIDNAEKDVEKQWGKGLYIDIHDHGHESSLIELGYLLENSILMFEDSYLDDDLFIEKSSLRNLAKDSPYSFAEIVRGDVSFGSYLESYGYKVVPSPSIPAPGTDFFYSGGYNTKVHGPNGTNHFSSFQIELPWDNIPEEELDIHQFSLDFMNAIIKFMKTHYGFDPTKL